MKLLLNSATTFLLGFSLVQAEVTITEKEGQLAVSIDGNPFTKYRTKDVNNPCFFPVIGPEGLSMTRHYPLEKAREGEADDHPHHTSLWFTHGDVNGLDFWHGGGKHPEKGGKVVHTEVVHQSNGADEAKLVTRSRWLANKESKLVCEDERHYAFGKRPDGARYIDFQVTIKATNGDVVFGDTKEGSMSIRTHPELRLKGEVAQGKAVNSSGDKDKLLWGKAAKWVSYFGPVEGKDVGVAIFDHPENPRHPTTWHARDYGLIAANPYGYSYFYKGQDKKGDFKIANGESATFRYRFLFHKGNTETGNVQSEYDVFAKSKVPTAPKAPVLEVAK